ncbi:prenyltransferase/squalene oxidase repeat-containing protein [Planctomycetaceae bacterium SH139]
MAVVNDSADGQPAPKAPGDSGAGDAGARSPGTSGPGTSRSGTSRSVAALQLDGAGGDQVLPVPGKRFLLFQAVPAWLISMLVHMLALMVLALLTIATPEDFINVLSVSNSSENEGEIEEFTLAEIDPGESLESEEDTFEEMEPTTEPVQELQPIEFDQPLSVDAISPEMTDMVSTIAPSSELLQSVSQSYSQNLSSRSGATKSQLLKRYGGTEASEAAVAKALRWLSLHQLRNGAWTFNHVAVCRGLDGCDGTCDPSRSQSFFAATAMGILPFLGAGQTHMTGVHKDNVRTALAFLLTNGKQKRLGGMVCLDFTEPGGNMYSHGLVSIALCEAYAMTQDPMLMLPAQQALNFIAYAQDPRSGGWRYSPKASGDTSVTGWQVMALKSGHMGHLLISSQTIVGANNFLNLVAHDNGSSYKYIPEHADLGGHTPCQPIGLLSRMYMGWDKTHPSIIEGVSQLSERGVLKNDIYYNYYAAQVLRHFGGSQWDKFNAELRDWLVDSQVDSGHAEGSWHWPDSVGHRGPREGGRLCSTSFATMILEVYYRHMPLYADSAADDEFPL